MKTLIKKVENFQLFNSVSPMIGDWGVVEPLKVIENKQVKSSSCFKKIIFYTNAVLQLGIIVALRVYILMVNVKKK